LPDVPIDFEPLTLGHFQVVATTTLIVGACMLLHYEAFAWLSGKVPQMHVQRRRQRVLALMFALLTLHIVEIWLFAAGYWLLLSIPGTGELVVQGMPDASFGFLDYVYFSAVVSTTLGLGEIFPVGPIRFLVGTESLVGFLLITWSASFMFIEMSRFWSGQKPPHWG